MTASPTTPTAAAASADDSGGDATAADPRAVAPPAGVTDPRRVAAVHATGLLDTDVEETFDRLTRLAVRLVGVPAAFVSLVDANRDFYKSACGFGEPLATARELTGPTFCHDAVQRTTPLVIPDTAADPAYRDVPTVRTLGVAAYVGLPLVAGGQTVGAFCAIDTRPRAWTADEIEVLTELAAATQRELDFRTAAAAAATSTAQLLAQQADLEESNRLLQAQAAELEAQADELEATAVELEERTEALGAARDLAEAERARTVAVLEATADAYVALDADFRIVEVNRAMERGRGLPRGELLGRDFWDVFPGAVGTAFEDHCRRAAAGVSAHFTHDHSDGRLAFVVEVDAYPAPTGDTPGGVALFWRDVTERVRAEGERARLLAESEAARAEVDLERRRLAATLEQLPLGVHIAEAPTGRLVMGNAAVRRIWGGAPASASVEDYSADYVATHRDGPRAGQPIASHEWPLARALAHGEVVEDEVVEVARGDGSRVLVSLSAAPVRDADGAVVGGVVTSTDVTEREQLLTAERVAVGRAQLLQALTAAFSAALTPEAVVHVLLERGVPALGAITGLVLLTSADGARLTLAGAYGYPPGADARFANLPLDAPLPVAAVVREQRSVWIEDPEAGGRAYADLPPVYAATGARASAALPLTDGVGQVIGALAFNYGEPRRFDPAARAFLEAVARQCAQALERARLFAAERAARAEAEAANRAKSQFLATMSHELRTPLNAIAGYAELLALGVRGPVTPAQSADLERLRRANDHLTTLVTDVLNFARLDAARVEYRAEVVRLGPLVADLETLVGPQLTAKGLTYVHDACEPDDPERPCVARADPDKVRQVLLNLVTNAGKFTPAGGRVSVVCEDDVAARVVRVRVTDTGRGIPADQLPHVFEPFVQVDRNLTHASQQGVGLGLAISRELARGMGGDVTAESVVGVGSTFTLTLPSATPPSATPPSAAPTTDAPPTATSPDRAV